MRVNRLTRSSTVPTPSPEESFRDLAYRLICLLTTGDERQKLVSGSRLRATVPLHMNDMTIRSTQKTKPPNTNRLTPIAPMSVTRSPTVSYIVARSHTR